jgi:plastocyanin domain-containing protein
MALRWCGGLAVFACLLSMLGSAQEQAPNRREFTIEAREGQFTPNRLEVSQDDLVRITLESADTPYSFAIDAYRIVKRVGAGQSLSFEFRAAQPGTFDFYCTLTGCAARGTLAVKARSGP